MYDFSPWPSLHPGGADPISRFARDGGVALHFPHWHTMEGYWQPRYRRLRASGGCHLLPTVAACITCGYSLYGLLHTATLPTVTAWMTYYLRSQPPLPAVTDTVSHYIRLQPPCLHDLRLHPPTPTVAASTTYGCSLHHLRLQPPSPTVAGLPELELLPQHVGAREVQLVSSPRLQPHVF